MVSFGIKPVAFALLGSLALAGCDGGFGGRTDPVIASPIGPDIHALATQADRRLVLATRVPGTENDDRTYLVMCAEPSPDAIEALAASVNASLNATQGDKALTAQQTAALATATSSIMKRSQGLQFFRDGVFALCQGSMNGLRDQNSTQAIIHEYRQLRQDAKELILAEIKTSNWNAAAPIIVNPPPVTAVKGTGENKD